MQTRTIRGAVLAVILAVATVSAAGLASAAGERRDVAAVPAGFEQYLVYMSEPTPVDEPMEVNWENFLAFQEEAFGRDAEAVDAFRQDAETFFLERFGIDLSDDELDEVTGTKVDAETGAILSPGFVVPERNYRAYTIGGERVPASGWEVRDASYNLTFPSESVLDGEFEGTAPAGSMVVFGDYDIAPDRPGNSENAPGTGGTIRIHFQSGFPIYPNDEGVMVFICDLESEEWGTGQARGIVTPDGGIRNVLTFPASLS